MSAATIDGRIPIRRTSSTTLGKITAITAVSAPALLALCLALASSPPLVAAAPPALLAYDDPTCLARSATDRQRHRRELLGRQQTTDPSSSTTSSTASPSSTPSGGFGDPNGRPTTALSVFTFIIAIALFVLVVAFVLLRIFVRNRRLRRLGLLPGDLDLGGGGVGGRMGAGGVGGGGGLGGGRGEIEDTLVPPKLWEAKIADLEALQRLKAARARAALSTEKIQGWEGIMPVAAALPTNLYVSLVPDGGKNDKAKAGAAGANGGQGGSAGDGSRRPMLRGLGRLLRRSEATPAAVAAASETHEGGATGGAETSDEDADAAAKKAAETAAAAAAAKAAENDVPVPAAVNVTVLIAMPSPKTVFPSKHNLLKSKSKASMLSFVSAASGSKPSLLLQQQQQHPADSLSKTRVDEVDEEDATADDSMTQDKGKTKRAPSVRSVRTAVSALSFAEARREAFFKAEEEGADADGEEGAGTRTPRASESAARAMPSADQRSEYFDHDDDDDDDEDDDDEDDDEDGRGKGIGGADDEEEELPELMFGTASVPMYRDWALASSTPGASTAAAAVPVPEDLIIPTRGDLLSLLAAAQQAKERKVGNGEGVAQLKED